MRRRAQNALAAKVVEEGEQSYHGEVPPIPPRRRRGRGRPRAVVAQEVEQEPPVEQKAPKVDLVIFVAGMVGINQGFDNSESSHAFNSADIAAEESGYV